MPKFTERPLVYDLLEIINSSWVAQAVCVFAELEIADHLRERPMTSQELAARTKTHEPSLYRLLRAVTTIDICVERKDGTFELTQRGTLLASDVPDSIRSWTIWWGKHLWQVWGKLIYSVKTGQSARKLLTGMESFEYLELYPDTAAMFQKAIGELTHLMSGSIVRTYDFSGFRRIMDVGGGRGELLLSILVANPGVSGILFDLPHVVKDGKRRFEEAGLSLRCEFVGGNFFEAVPAGADAYLLKNVIHDWDDERSGRILTNCRRTMADDARLLIVERVIPSSLEPSEDHRAIARNDLTMLVAHAAQERTEREFQFLLEAAGFRMTRLVPAAMAFSIIEARPVT